MKTKIIVAILALVSLGVGVGIGYLIFNKPVNNTSNTNNGNTNSNTTPNNQNANESNFNQTIKVLKDKTYVIKDDNEELAIKLVSVSDSRCPKDAQCIWAGEIVYDITINENKATLGTENNSSVEYENYIIKLADNNDSLEFVNLIVTKK